MNYLGLTPSESCSGEKEHKGPITKTGNKRVRRLLTEVTWHHRHAYGVSKGLRKRREGSLNRLLTSQTEQGYDYAGVIIGLLIGASCLAKQ
jgi:transposase